MLCPFLALQFSVPLHCGGWPKAHLPAPAAELSVARRRDLVPAMPVAAQSNSQSLLTAALAQDPGSAAAPDQASRIPQAESTNPKGKAMPTVPLPRATGALPQGQRLVRKRGRVPDLDEALQATASVVEAAKKQMKQAQNLRRNATRRRARYIAKAAKCSNEDLYKIAVYKRTDFLTRMIDHDPQGLQGAIGQLLQHTSKESAEALLKQMAGQAANLPSSGASRSGSGGDSAAAEAGGEFAKEDAFKAGTPLPVLPPLAAPMEMADGSEQFLVPAADASQQQMEGGESPPRDED